MPCPWAAYSCQPPRTGQHYVNEGIVYRGACSDMVLIVREVFCLTSEVTLIVGRVRSPPLRIGAVTATVFLRGHCIGMIQLTGERMPGPLSLPEQRTVETSDVFAWEEEGIQAGSYELRW